MLFKCVWIWIFFSWCQFVCIQSVKHKHHHLKTIKVFKPLSCGFIPSTNQGLMSVLLVIFWVFFGGAWIYGPNHKISGQKKWGSVTYSTEQEKKGSKIFMKYLEANRGKRFQFKETFEFSGLYIEIQSTKLPIIVCTVTKIYDKVQLERTALGGPKNSCTFIHVL